MAFTYTYFSQDLDAASLHQVTPSNNQRGLGLRENTAGSDDGKRGRRIGKLKMRTSELNDAIGRLERATHRLREAWIETRKAWDDSVAEDFEARHLEPVLPQLRYTVTAIQQLMGTFDQVGRVCSDPDAASESF